MAHRGTYCRRSTGTRGFRSGRAQLTRLLPLRGPSPGNLFFPGSREFPAMQIGKSPPLSVLRMWRSGGKANGRVARHVEGFVKMTASPWLLLGPNVIFTEPPTGAATQALGKARPVHSCRLALRVLVGRCLSLRVEQVFQNRGMKFLRGDDVVEALRCRRSEMRQICVD